MAKVICDICGTEYPASASNCPLCGGSREFALENEDALLDAEMAAAFEAEAAAPARKNKGIFDYDEVNRVKPSRKAESDDDDDEDDDDEDDEDEDDDDSRSNVGLVVVLVILIVLLLLTAGFFFVKYLLPNMAKPVETEPVATTEAVIQTEAVETTDPTIPCASITIVEGGKIDLGKDGKFLMNVHVYPEDTTDVLTYVSGDESIVTVDEKGSVSAVAEGETTITVRCGSQTITCHVTVAYEQVQETVPEGTIPAMEVEDPTEAPAETAEDATEAAKETVPADTGLKLKKEDITIGSNYTSVKLELEGDIDPATLKWFTMDSSVCIVHDGVVTSTGSGMTKVYGEANGQQVACVVRCVF